MVWSSVIFRLLAEGYCLIFRAFVLFHLRIHDIRPIGFGGSIIGTGWHAQHGN